MKRNIARLVSVACEYRRLEDQATALRKERDDLVLHLVDGGRTWREVAQAAGIHNPYIAYLKRRPAPPEVSA